MQNLKSLMLRALVAPAMFSSAGQLSGSPVYHVSIVAASLANPIPRS